MNSKVQELNKKINELNIQIQEINNKIEFIDSFLEMGTLRKMNALICESKKLRIDYIRSMFISCIIAIIIRFGNDFLWNFFPVAIGMCLDFTELRFKIEKAKIIKINEKNGLLQELKMAHSRKYELEIRREIEITKDNLNNFSKHYQSFKLRPRSEFLEEQNFGMEAENKTSIGNNHNVYQKKRKK